jgi:hypothetical protein
LPLSGIDATYTPAGGEPVPVRMIARRPDTIVGFEPVGIAPFRLTLDHEDLATETGIDMALLAALLARASLA